MQIEKKKLSELNPAPYNPRTISDAALAGLKASMDRFGCVELIVFNARTGHIVSGHQRYKVLQSEGVTDTDVVVVDLDESEEKALNVAMNNPNIAGDWTPELQLLLSEIKVELPEYEDLRLDFLETTPADFNPMDEWKGMPEFNQEDKMAYRIIHVHFDTEEDVQNFAQLIDQKVTEKTKYLWHPYKSNTPMMDKRYE